MRQSRVVGLLESGSALLPHYERDMIVAMARRRAEHWQARHTISSSTPTSKVTLDFEMTWVEGLPAMLLVITK